MLKIKQPLKKNKSPTKKFYKCNKAAVWSCSKGLYFDHFITFHDVNDTYNRIRS